MKTACVATCAMLVAAGACSQSTAPPTDRTGPVPVSGRLLFLQAGTPVAGATVSTSASTNTALTDSAGTFRIEGEAALWSVSFTGEGFVPRGTRINIVNPIVGLNVNAISLAPPFSLDYYREAVRGALDYPGQMFALSRWTQAPRFYFLTRTLDTGDVVPDAVIDKMQAFAVQLTPPLTGGRFVPAQMERGPQPPAPATGWIIVESYTNGIPGAPGAGGDSWVGLNPGRIRLLLRTETNALCGFGMAGAFFHEIVHALGFWHVTDGFSVNNACGQLMPALEYHAAIAYARPVGNRDPDNDQYYAAPAAAITIR